jgi:Flp pilus assembly protein TadD
MRREWLICLALSAITLIGFWPVGHLGFILFDDHHYVTENPNVQAGITADSIRWAFTTTRAGNWHPVTWLSHMLDFKLFGLNASGHHWVNLGFHIANTLLLFIVLRQMTQTVWRSALVAALFALHPMRVESVAWVSERKDVLSAFFFLLTLWAWVRYAQRQSRVEPSSLRSAAPGSRESSAGSGSLALDPRHRILDYFLALLFFALGLMSKPMLVTLPVILLLLDFWPLGRISEFGVRSSDLKNAVQHPVLRRLLWEKAPFLALSVASSLVTFWAQQAAEYVVSANLLPWHLRIANSLVFYTDYLGKMFWPVNLAIFYPYTPMHLWEFICSALLPVLLSFFCIRRMLSHRWLFVGWFWFVVMLVPVIGLVQVGMQSMADRYTYLPSIGLFIVVSWVMAGLASRSQLWQTGMVLGATALIAGCLLDTRHQLHYWRDNVTLFSHAAEVAQGSNSKSNFLLGNAYAEAGNMDAAARSFRTTLQIAPDFEQAHDKLGRVLFQQKKYDEARAQFDEILQLHPDNAEAHKCLGCILATQGKYAEAGSEYTAALQLKPDDAVIRTALAFVSEQVKVDQVLTNLYNTLKILPKPEAHVQIAVIRTTRGEFPDAVGHYLEALRLKPDAPDALNNLAWLLATCPEAPVRDGAQAVKYAEHACELTHYKQTIMVGTLAAAYAEAGRFGDAIATAQKACTLAAAGDQGLLKRNQELLALYLKHQPYHEVAGPDQTVPSAVAHPVSGGTEKLVPAAP